MSVTREDIQRALEAFEADMKECHCECDMPEYVETIRQCLQENLDGLNVSNSTPLDYKAMYEEIKFAYDVEKTWSETQDKLHGKYKKLAEEMYEALGNLRCGAMSSGYPHNSIKQAEQVITKYENAIKGE